MAENPRQKLLAVDDEQSSLNAIFRTLRREFEVILSLNGYSALEVLKNQEIAVILGDQRMPNMTGVNFFKKSLELQPDAVKILITGYADIEAIIDAINEGQIFYYINKPWEPEDLRIIVRRAAQQYFLIRENQRLMRELDIANQRLQEENIILHKEIERQYVFDNIVGTSTAIQNVFSLMRRVIPTDTTVMILGETGTGKELIAKAIHYNSSRQKNLFAAQNCSSLPDTLLESELFGHKRGAFTGAISDKKGLFELADGGTIFLDEIGDTSPAMQQRLLRVFQEGEFKPLGSEKSKNVDVRIISATNKDLQQEIRDGRFREDLFYRLNVFPIEVPPLRERREDIPLLVEYFIKKCSLKMGKTITGISQKALSSLVTENFPGNVRQLENLIERAVTLLSDNSEITLEQIGLENEIGQGLNESSVIISDNLKGNLKEITETIEKKYVTQSLKKHGGNITKAAKDLGLSRVGLHKKIKRYNINIVNYKLG
jgi:two-component system response regulator HupR/HoxA